MTRPLLSMTADDIRAELARIRVHVTKKEAEIASLEILIAKAEKRESRRES